MIPKLLHRTVKCFDKLRDTRMGEYKQLWETMGVVVKDYTDQDVESYMEELLGTEDLEVYRNVKPMALRTDIWRLCVLYREGGIYSDVHIKPLLILEALFEEDMDHVFVIDNLSDTKRAYNAFIMAKPGSMLIWKALQRTMLHIREKIYPFNILDLTGPGVLGLVLRIALDQKDTLIEGWHRTSEGSVLLLSHVMHNVSSEKLELIMYEDQPVFQCRYPEYRMDMEFIGCDLRYQYYFYHRIIYNDDIRALREFLTTGVYTPLPISLERIKLEKEMMLEYFE